MKRARDGIQLSFDIARAGPPEFLFVHGLSGDRTHFKPQMKYFARQGRALTAELRGHGESDKPRQPYSIEGIAESWKTHDYCASAPGLDISGTTAGCTA